MDLCSKEVLLESLLQLSKQYKWEEVFGIESHATEPLYETFRSPPPTVNKRRGTRHFNAIMSPDSLLCDFDLSNSPFNGQMTPREEQNRRNSDLQKQPQQVQSKLVFELINSDDDDDIFDCDTVANDDSTQGDEYDESSLGSFIVDDEDDLEEPIDGEEETGDEFSDEGGYSEVEQEEVRPKSTKTPQKTPQRLTTGNREAITKTLYAEINQRAFQSKLPEDLKIIWSKRLLTTAGRAFLKLSREGESAEVLNEVDSGEDSENESADNELGEEVVSDVELKMTSDQVRTSHVELSIKVCDSYDRLKSTLVHELCHVAAWLIDGVSKPPHGKCFRKWGKHAMRYLPSVEVSRCHNYSIFKPHQWQCCNSQCQQVIKRHTKKGVKDRTICGRCKSDFQYVGSFTREGKLKKPREVTGFSKYVKENFSVTKKQLPPTTPHKDIMKALSQQYKGANDENTVPNIGNITITSN